MVEKKLDSKHMFEDLVNNGVDFLKHSVSQFKESPKYSVISFYSAIEIFLKARLMLEHWTLVVAKPEKADVRKFKAGDFKSVTLEEAVGRLEKVIGQKLSKDEFASFNGIRKHRNKLVHFFHAVHTGKPSAQALGEIAAEQCRGWYHLHRLLTETWKSEFSRFSIKIQELDGLMLTHKKYLQTKFDAISPEIAKLEKEGYEVSVCPSCDFDARIAHPEGHSLFYLKCLVCNAGSTVLELNCPECEKEPVFYDGDSVVCQRCHEKIDIQSLIDIYGGLQSPKERATEPEPEYCCFCGDFGEPTIIPWDDGYLCLSCLSFHEVVHQCEWCAERIAGELDGSYAFGCPRCDGKIGYHDD